MFKLIVGIKFIVLITGMVCIYFLLRNSNTNSTGIGIAAAGCFIAYALIENNDVQESNKD